jgi:hypothetical protein
VTIKLSENQIEQLAIEILVRLGFIHKWGPDLAPDGGYPERSSCGRMYYLIRGSQKP